MSHGSYKSEESHKGLHVCTVLSKSASLLKINVSMHTVRCMFRLLLFGILSSVWYFKFHYTMYLRCICKKQLYTGILTLSILGVISHNFLFQSLTREMTFLL